MKFFEVLALLTIFGFVSNSEDVCAGLADACINILLDSLLGDTTDAEVCREIRYAIKCLEAAVDDCLDDEEREELEDGRMELEDLQQEHCGKSAIRQDPVFAHRREQERQELEDISECLEDNFEYTYKCVNDGPAKAMGILTADANEFLIKCAIFGMTAACYVDRVGEKCGATAAENADEEFKDIPPEIKDACRLAGGVDVYSFQFSDFKRKK